MSSVVLAKPHSALAGIFLAIAAVASFATLDTTIKFISGGIPVLMALWFRFTFQLLATTAVFAPSRGARMLHTLHLRFQVLRGLLLLGTTVLAFLSLKHMPVAEFTAAISITPLVVTLLAAARLKQKVSMLRWALVAGGFAGTMVIVRPTQDDFSLAMLLPLLVVGMSTGFQLLTSRMAQTESPVTMHFYTGLVGTLVTSLALPFVWVTLESSTLWWCLGMIGIAGSAGHFLLILAYQRAEPAVLSPYLYGQIPFAMLGGWLVFSQVPDGWSMVGIALIALCGAVGAWQTRRDARVAASQVIF